MKKSRPSPTTSSPPAQYAPSSLRTGGVKQRILNIFPASVGNGIGRGRSHHSVHLGPEKGQVTPSDRAPQLAARFAERMLVLNSARWHPRDPRLRSMTTRHQLIVGAVLALSTYASVSAQLTAAGLDVKLGVKVPLRD